jgi:hypothetical protein
LLDGQAERMPYFGKKRLLTSDSFSPDHREHSSSHLPITGDIRTDRALLILASLITEIATGVSTASSQKASTPDYVEPQGFPRVSEHAETADE